jgi:hypothetical protein
VRRPPKTAPGPTLVVVGGGTRSGVLRSCALFAILVLGAGCAAEAAEPTVVPTFAAPTVTGAPGSAEERNGALPTDCADLLAVADLGALLGLPLDSVAVRTTIGVAEPSVGRTERVACRYSGTAASPVRGTLLDVNVARYVDAAAATKQWGTNTGVESGARSDLPIGAARSALFDRDRESVLMVAYDDDTLTFVLPEAPRPGGRDRGEVLVDLALRVLPAVGPPSSAPPATLTTVPSAVAAAG